MKNLPTGTVTFLFTDIEGSTRLLQQLGDRYAEVLAAHHRLLRSCIQDEHGHEMDAQGDALFVAFPRAKDALLAAVAAQRAMRAHSWPEGIILRVRMGLHTGEPLSGETGYVGMDVHRAARIAAAGHGGQILASDVTQGLVAKDLPDGVSLRDLGEHRLKDLADPLHLFQIVAADLPADFPPIRSLDVLPNNLPRQLTSFIGREREMPEIKRLLTTAYLVTLTGTGGAGKTRLALQVAADLLGQYPEGVWFVELAPLSNPALVPEAVASVLGVPEQSGRQLTGTLAEFLRSRHLLLLLDNCEHVISACQDLADKLLRACPNLRILATSREGLGVEGESTYRVPSLGLPDPSRLPSIATLAEYEAVRLFVERAALGQSSFSLTASTGPAVAQICHRLDGIPLAIEFAAARVKVLSVDQIAARLDDRFRLLTAGSRKTLPRHQTLRAMMDWSYDLLSEQEQAVLRGLSVFAGGWTLEAAENVCSGDSDEPGEVLNLLSQLVDKSLVVVYAHGSDARYRLLETVRHYGRERLAEAGEAEVMGRLHRAWYLALAEEAAPELHGPRVEPWLRRLETEHDNLRAALGWSEADKDGAEAQLRLVGALHHFWFDQGYWREARTWVERALTRSNEAPRSASTKVLLAATHFAWLRGDYLLAKTLGEQVLDLSGELGDQGHRAWSLFALGVVAARQEDYERATTLLDEGLNLSRELGNRWLCALCFADLGGVAQLQGDYKRATQFFTESLSLFRRIDNKRFIAYALRNLGNVALDQNDYGQASACFTESLVLCGDMGGRMFGEECLEKLAQVASATGQCEQAARLFGATEALRESLGSHETLGSSRHSVAKQADHDQRVASARSALGEGAFAAAWAEGRAMTLEQAIEYALTADSRPEEGHGSPSNVAPK